MEVIESYKLSSTTINPSTGIQYISCGVMAWGLEYSRPDLKAKELEGHILSGLYETVDFIQVDDVLRIVVTLTDKGVKWWSNTKNAGHFYSTFMIKTPPRGPKHTKFA